MEETPVRTRMPIEEGHAVMVCPFLVPAGGEDIVICSCNSR